jgi:hypothetical protein
LRVIIVYINLGDKKMRILKLFTLLFALIFAYNAYANHCQQFTSGITNMNTPPSQVKSICGRETLNCLSDCGKTFGQHHALDIKNCGIDDDQCGVNGGLDPSRGWSCTPDKKEKFPHEC